MQRVEWKRQWDLVVGWFGVVIQMFLLAESSVKTPFRAHLCRGDTIATVGNTTHCRIHRQKTPLLQHPPPGTPLTAEYTHCRQKNTPAATPTAREHHCRNPPPQAFFSLTPKTHAYASAAKLHRPPPIAKHVYNAVRQRGFYSYGIFDRPKGMPEVNINQFHYMAISEKRQREMPMPEDRIRGVTLDHPEAVRLTNPTNSLLKGEMFVSTHYAGEDVGMKFKAGEQWKKVFGPVFIYLNSASNNHKSALWQNAKSQMSKEIESWPYNFSQSPDFPHSNQRGSVSGQLLVRDGGQNSMPAAHAQVGLAPPGNEGSWQYENKGYQFWSHADGEGNFWIKGVRPGNYNLFAWVPGTIGDYKYGPSINISPGLPHKVNGKRKRGESRAKTKPDQTAVPEEVNMKKVNYRSNITGLVKLLKDTKFTSGQLKCLRKTPFWPLFDCLISNEIDLNHCMKYDDVIVPTCVYGGELMASPTEAKMYHHTKLSVEPKPEILDAFSVDAMDLNDVGHYINPSCSTPNAEKGIIIAQPTEPDIVEVLIKENQKAWGLVRVIAALEAKLFDQSGPSNVDMDMKTCMEWKDTEIQRLTKLVINLECEKTILQDIFDDQSVHIITQVEAQKAHDSLNKHPTAALEHIISPPSRVKRIKQKVRKEHRLDEFEYPNPNLPGQKKRKEGAEEQSHAVQIAQDLDKQPPKKQPTKSKKLTLNNKLKVWANMNKLNKQKVQNLHKNGGDDVARDLKTKDVYFDDIIHIIKEESITNNVTDAYGEILLELQELVNPSLEDSSFIFASTCLIKNHARVPPHKRNKLIDVHIKEYQGQRFLIFPIHDNFHWTIVVYDMKENVWRHYNSLRPREGIHDPHIDKAQILRDYITALVHNIGRSSPLWTNLSSQNTSKTIISVDICPQQASNSVDCGPAVCYIMRVHVYRSNIKLNNLVYEAPRAGPTLWEIGIANRVAAEFFIPDPNPSLVNHLYNKFRALEHTKVGFNPYNYMLRHINNTYICLNCRFRQYELWNRYTKIYPRQDLMNAGNKSYQVTTWQILFDIKTVNKAANYTLRLALASAHVAELHCS
ncbi:unnamed protein product [Camellia sinensis]